MDIFKSFALFVTAVVVAVGPFLSKSDEGAEAIGIEKVDPRKPIRRRPIEIAIAGQNDRLVVANQLSGTVSLIDISENTVLGEWKVAECIGDLVPLKNDRFLVTDQSERGHLHCLSLDGNDEFRIDWSQPTVGFPNQICLDVESQSCFVTGLWSQQIAKHDLEQSTEIISPTKVDVPFAAGNAILIQDGSVILVADAFGGSWASFDSKDLTPIQRGDFGSRRICGLHSWTSPDTDEPAVAVVSQPLNRLAQAIRNDVHWGLMVANEVIIKDENSFLDPDWQESRRSSIPLGGPGEAKGDPESIEFASSGEVAITIGGVGQVAIGDLTERSFAYVPTGNRPINSCFSEDGESLFVANFLDDSITRVDVSKYEAVSTLPLGATPELTDLDRGERLFFDATVSHDSWMSCHSCHVNGHTNGFLNDNFSDQSFGAPKRVLSLLGHGDTAPFAWNGSKQSLEEQICSSIEKTMQTDDDFDDTQIAALSRFVKSLSAPPSLARARGIADPVSFAKGEALFAELGCIECHSPPHYTSARIENVGTPDELGKTAFNPPSLVGVSQRQRLFHDGRYLKIQQIFGDDPAHQLNREISDEELNLLVGFLRHL